MIGSVPAGVVARTSPSTRTSKAGMAPVARLKNASWARTDSSNGSPGATTLGAKPCTPATRVPLITNGRIGSGRHSPEASRSTYSGSGIRALDVPVISRPCPPPLVSP